MKNEETINVATQVTEQQFFLEKKTAQALHLAHAKSDATEVTVIKTTGISIRTRYGEIENLEFNNDSILDITVYSKQCKGSASSSDLSSESITRTITAALDIAHYTSPDPASGLAEKTLLAYDAPDLNLFHPIELNAERGIMLASTAEKTAMQSDKRIIHTEGGYFNSQFSTRVFGNSHGLLQSYNTSRHSISCSVIAEQNGSMERNYAYTLNRDFDDLLSPQWVGRECARRTLAHLNPRKLPTMVTPVLFAAEVASELFKHLAEAISGGNVYRKSTFLLNHLGESIFPDWLSINERPHVPKGLASSPFDNEGVKTQNYSIVKNGILSTWLLNSYSARKLGLQSTGHAGGIHNWYITHHDMTFTELMKKMEKGLIVTELMGQGVSTISGDYSRGASGFWVEHGEIKYPVSEITIASNLADIFKNIVYIGNNIETRRNIQCGGVLVKSMKIAGQ